MMNYSELLKNRRSVRDFKNKSIPTEIIHEILQEACLAPSACNNQPWRFVVVQDQQVMKKISDQSKRYYLETIAQDSQSHFCQFENLFANPDFNVFYNAPALILVVGENKALALREGCINATIYLMFSATARDLGTCWIGLAHEKALRQELGLADNYQIISAVIMGYPESIPKVSPRNKLIIVKSVKEQTR